MNKTSIEWTEFTANPIRARNHETGKAGHFCEKVSPGCAHCYASEWNEKRYGTGAAFLPANRERVDMYLEEKVLTDILKYKGPPAKLFLCDMTDLFAEWVPDDWLDRIFATMALQPRLTFQVLTKRPERMREYVCRFGRKGCVEAAAAAAVWQPWGFSWPLPNVWLGVSVENQHWADVRIPQLLDTPAAVRFLSCEPLLGALELTRWLRPSESSIDYAQRVGYDRIGERERIDWIIAGGESAGPAKRALVKAICECGDFQDQHSQVDGHCLPCLGSRQPWPVCRRFRQGGFEPKPEALEWVRSLRDACVAAGTPYFFKQWPIPPHKPGGPALIDGREWRQFPEAPA